MSRDEMVKLVEAAEREIPDAVVDAELRREEKIELNEVEPKSPPSPLPSQRPAEWKKPVTTPSKDTAKVSPPVVRTEPVITSSPTPVTKKESPKEVPKTEPGPPIPGEPTVADNGVDDDDERFASDYTGPKTVVDHPSSSGEYRLSEVAANFGMMRLPKENYSALQKKLMGSSMKACNFFFAAALIEAGAPASDGATATRDHYPAWLAADLDTKYFNSKSAGWERITLVQMKQWFQERRNFDVAIQRDAPPGKKHGHIAIPIGLNADGKVLVAEASYKTVANRIAAYSDVSIATKFRIYARYKKD